ncbi:MAG: cytochrome c [Acidobacteria bacterium]|nr:cytochrome c [Acidobacteriota bacterium]
MRLVAAALFALGAVSAASSQVPPDTATRPITFVADVAPIFHKHCISCHRAGEMAPMSLVTYAESRPWAKAIRNQVVERRMPPWFADPAIGHFANDIRLSDRDVDVIARWVGEGAPRGDGPEPTPPENNDGWRIGKPDLVLKLQQPFDVPARGIVEYQYFQIPTNLTEDRWVQAIEIRPTDRRTVHHLRVFARPPGPDVPRAAISPDRSLCPEEVCGDLEPPLAGFGPNIASIGVGTLPDVFPLGTAKRLKAGSVISLHVHYVTTGTSVTDQTEIGFVFAKSPPAIELKTISLAQEKFVIPPKTASHAVVGTVHFQVDAALWTLGPHSHLRGKSWRFDLIDPEGQQRPLLAVPQFDFNWQTHYVFDSPIPVKAGSRLQATAVFDNSPANQDNPDPDAAVRWGNQTTDEMMFASVTYSVKSP